MTTYLPNYQDAISSHMLEMVHIRAGNLTDTTSHIIYAQQLAYDRWKVVSLPGFSHKKAATTSFKRSRMSGSIRSLPENAAHAARYTHDGQEERYVACRNTNKEDILCMYSLRRDLAQDVWSVWITICRTLIPAICYFELYFKAHRSSRYQ